MATEKKTNICCFDLDKSCLDYLNSLDFDVYDGSLGSVVTIDWSKLNRSDVPVLVDYKIPENIQEYHVFIHDMDNARVKDYDLNENNPTDNLESGHQRYLECSRPISKYNLRPYCTHFLRRRFDALGEKHKRISIVFASEYHDLEYVSNEISYHSPEKKGPYDNYEAWTEVNGYSQYGKKVRLVDGRAISSLLFQEHLDDTEYYRVFNTPLVWEGNNRIPDRDFLPLLTDEDGSCVSFAYVQGPSQLVFILPQVKNKAGLLKSLFDNLLFSKFSDFFPDIEAKQWIHNKVYALPDEQAIRNKIDERTKEYEKELAALKEEEKKVQNSNLFLKQLLTESGDELVNAVKSFLEYLGFDNVVDRDSILKADEKKEEDLYFEYNGSLVVMEVKGINGTSTDSECSQIDKVVLRRIREKGSANVHGVYVVNNQKNIEPLKRTWPPFNKTQLTDAQDESRTMIFTSQLFSLYSDIENGYVTKESVRAHFLKSGLANFHDEFISLGVPPKFYKDRTVLCFHLKDKHIIKGDMVYFFDELHRLVGATVLDIHIDGQSLDETSEGEVSVEVSLQFPRGGEVFVKKEM